MFLIQQITSDPFQQQQLTLPDSSTFILQLYFRQMQFGWFVPEIVYGNFVLKGLRITNSPNMLNQFRNQIPFGLACYSMGEREPSQLEDFSSGASKLYILSQAECTAYAQFLESGSLL